MNKVMSNPQPGGSANNLEKLQRAQSVSIRSNVKDAEKQAQRRLNKRLSFVPGFLSTDKDDNNESQECKEEEVCPIVTSDTDVKDVELQANDEISMVNYF
jgi:isopentenyldiphosphate isomerase